MTKVHGVLDTSIIVRYRIGRPRRTAKAARAIVEAAHTILVPLVGLVETADVLTAVYHILRDATADALIALVQRPNIIVLGPTRNT